ncbi:MAG: hypothetical protein CVV17_07560 [Gammaproteobacteria bacterium HGW-Gammaproteobacteria-7]|nr:MAG: hypothetical protein CVV17_07560 [Gammaproteobacteria bacterium HGW-Gammaproteobacteria-7]
MKPIHATRSAFTLLLVLAFALAFPIAAVSAQDEPSGEIASTWIIWAKPGAAADFEKALKSHAAWRKQAGDPMNWRIYAPVAGDDLNHYVIRSDGHHWKDFDAENAWAMKAGAGDAFNQQVGVYVAEVKHYFDRHDAEHSHWTDNSDYRYFSVNTIRFLPGQEPQFYAALKTVAAAAKAGDWGRSWSIMSLTGGSNDINVVWPYTSYADMAQIEPGFVKVLGDHMGSPEAARELLDGIGATIAESSSTIYVYRPDLSTPQ